MIKADLSEWEDLENKFKIFAKRAYPFATKFALNDAAFMARGVARNDIKQKMILRNQWTKKGIKVEKVRGLNVDRQFSLVGSVDDYMERQEFGGTLRKKGKRGKQIYTAESAGLARGTQPVTKLPVPTNRMGKTGKITLLKRSTAGGTKKQQSQTRIRQAVRAKQRHVYLELSGKAKGIFLIKGRGKKKKITLVQDMSRDSVRTPPNPWLRPAVLRVAKQLPRIFHRQMVRQAKRHRLFGY